jgi:hypothetical protein
MGPNPGNAPDRGSRRSLQSHPLPAGSFTTRGLIPCSGLPTPEGCQGMLRANGPDAVSRAWSERLQEAAGAVR